MHRPLLALLGLLILHNAEARAAEVFDLYSAQAIVTGTEEPERTRGFRAGIVDAVIKLTGDSRLADGDLGGACAAAQHVLVRDPLREEGHAILIEVHGRSGSRSQVIRQYRRLASILDRELGEAPLPDTDATYRLALERAVARSRQRAAAIASVVDPVDALERPHLLALANG